MARRKRARHQVWVREEEGKKGREPGAQPPRPHSAPRGELQQNPLPKRGLRLTRAKKERQRMLAWSEYVQALPVDDSETLAAYGFGSRAYALHSVDSDHDLVVVVRDTCALLPAAGWLEHRWGEVNATVYGESVWRARLAACELQCFMARSCPLVAERFDPPLASPVLRARLKLTVATEAARHYRSLARRAPGAENLAVARKMVFFGLRDWLLGAQVALHEKVVDRAAALPLHALVHQCPATSVAELHAALQGQYDCLKAAFFASVEPPDDDEAAWCSVTGAHLWFSLRALPLGADAVLLYPAPETPWLTNARAQLLSFAVLRGTRVVARCLQCYPTDAEKHAFPHGIVVDPAPGRTRVFAAPSSSAFVSLVRVSKRETVAVALTFHPLANDPAFVEPVVCGRHVDDAWVDCAPWFVDRLNLRVPTDEELCVTLAVTGGDVAFPLACPNFYARSLTPRASLTLVHATRAGAVLCASELESLHALWPLAPALQLPRPKLGAVAALAYTLAPGLNQGVMLVSGALRVLVLSPHVRRLWAALNHGDWFGAALECALRCPTLDASDALFAALPELAPHWARARACCELLCAELERWADDHEGAPAHLKPMLLHMRQRNHERLRVRDFMATLQVSAIVHQHCTGVAKSK